METAANNLANISTPGYGPKRVEATAVNSGGVRGAVNEASPAEIDEAFIPGTAVDVTNEMVTMISAVSAYRANLAVLRSADDAERALLDAFV